MKFTLLCVTVACMCCSCEPGKTKTSPLNSIKTASIEKNHEVLKSSITEFEEKIYLKIDEVHTGPVYLDADNDYVFNRILVVPEEENIMLICEIILIGKEGSAFKLKKLSRLTDNNSLLPKFGLSSADSIRFIDSVTVQGIFNKERKSINLRNINAYKTGL